MASRGRAYLCLVQHAPLADAQDLEHACHIISGFNDASYQQLIYTLLWVLEQNNELTSLVLSLTKTENAMSALSKTSVFGCPSASFYDQVSARDLKHRECKKLVEDLAVSGGSLDLPKAGVKCSHCKCFDISFEFSQTRSADEGMTVFCYCTKCEKRWTM